MLKKVFKSLTIAIFSLLLLSGCGKKPLTTQEIFDSSINNFNSVKNYTLNLNADIKISSNGADLASIKTSPSIQVDNISKIACSENKIDISFLFFNDVSNSITYDDFANQIKYVQEQKEGEENIVIKDSLDSKSNPSYILNVFLNNGVQICGDYTEYNSDYDNFYVIPLKMDYSLMSTFIQSLSLKDSYNINEETKINIPQISDEEKVKLQDVFIGFNYFIDKNSLLPARISVDIDSFNNFCIKITEILSDDEDLSSFIDISSASFSINNLNLSIGDYNQETSLIIPEDIINNSISKEELEQKEQEEFDIIEENIIEENIEEEYEEIEIPEFEFKEFNENIFSFNINDEKDFSFPMTINDFKELGYQEVLEKDEMLKPGKYSAPIQIITTNNDSFYVTVMNDSLEEKSILDCFIIRVEFDKEDFSSELIVSNDISFNSDVRDLKYDFEEESFIYEGDISTIYTYQYEESKYISFQIDNETEKVCFISITYI